MVLWIIYTIHRSDCYVNNNAKDRDSNYCGNAVSGLIWGIPKCILQEVRYSCTRHKIGLQLCYESVSGGMVPIIGESKAPHVQCSSWPVQKKEKEIKKERKKERKFIVFFWFLCYCFFGFIDLCDMYSMLFYSLLFVDRVYCLDLLQLW